MRILFATSEVAPLIKTGGLADMSAALPHALHQMGLDVHVLTPAYPQVLRALPHLHTVAEFHALPGFPVARLLEGKLPCGVPLWAIEFPELYQRGGGNGFMTWAAMPGTTVSCRAISGCGAVFYVPVAVIFFVLLKP